MPSRNVIREFAEHQYYHVYNRGVEKRIIFLDEQDYAVFLGLIKKYLTGKNSGVTPSRHKFDSLEDRVELVAYCLMPNHFHLLLYQIAPDGITRLMRRVSTGYVMYFNNRYRRTGTLFQGNYKASLIGKDDYLHHISRYIHLNPADYKTWPYSSWPNFTGRKKTSWVKPAHIMELFNNSTAEYEAFVSNYVDTKAELSLLKWHLANNPEEN